MVTKQLIEKNVKQFLNFVNNSPSPFHAVYESKKLLTAAGFEELKEKENWEGKIKPSGKYYFTRNQSSIVAFAVGGHFVSFAPYLLIYY
jgi:aspartyl aminopeptidase